MRYFVRYTKNLEPGEDEVPRWARAPGQGTTNDKGEAYETDSLEEAEDIARTNAGLVATVFARLDPIEAMALSCASLEIPVARQVGYEGAMERLIGEEKVNKWK